MFNRKRREIERLRTENKDLICKLGNATTRYSHKVAELYERLYEERDEQSKRLEELERSLVKQKEINKELVEDHEEDLRTISALREKIEEAQRDSTCPADCVHRTNPNACRTCIRYPKAHDKYEVAE